MSKKLVVAIGLAVVAVVALYLYSQSLQSEVAGGQKVQVLVAADAIKPGTRVTRANLALREVPEQYLLSSSIRKGEENTIIGRRVSNAVEQGQPLSWSDFELQRSSAARQLSATVQKGQRALTLPVDVSGSLAGMLRPGDHVDVLGTFARAQQEFATVTLLQNVLVLATGELRGGGEGESDPAPAAPPGKTFNNITVSVDPEEAELLAFAMQRGPLNISLRAQQDFETVDDMPEKSFGDVFDTRRRADFTRRHAAKKINELKPQ